MACKNPITIFRGDDTDAFSLRTITIKLTGDLTLTGATAKFSLLTYSKSWDTIPSSGELTMVMTQSDTKSFPIGLAFGTLTLYDGTKKLTVCNTIPFDITNKVDGIQTESFDIDVTLAVDTEINIAFSTSVGTIAVGTVTTLDAGSSATVENVGTATNAIFNFGIPRGQDGVAGWEKKGDTRLRPSITGVTALSLPILDSTSAISGSYTLADVKNLCNTLLNALKG